MYKIAIWRNLVSFLSLFSDIFHVALFKDKGTFFYLYGLKSFSWECGFLIFSSALMVPEINSSIFLIKGSHTLEKREVV